MNAFVGSVGRIGSVGVARLADYLELTKPRIAVLVLITVVVGASSARWGQPDPWSMLHAVLGTALVAASASAMNQWWERKTDRLMRRTFDRPLAAGRLAAREVLVFGATLAIVGIFDLLFFTNLLTASLAVITWASYVLIYTPMKRRTHWNTLVGAIGGALPVLIGWASTGASFDARAVALFLLIFLWQFPHFMAIAWLYRRQYANAGIQMITVTDPTGRRAGHQALLGAIAVIPVSLVPAALSPPSLVYLLVATALGVIQLGCAIRFTIRQDELTSRRLLHISLVYLPAVLILLAWVPFL
ncbi:MAG: heme o synthase [Pirellulaceae bacterium]